MISLKCDYLLFVSAHHLSALIKLSAIVFAEDFFLTKFGRGLKSNTKDVLLDIADGVKTAKVLQQRSF